MKKDRHKYFYITFFVLVFSSFQAYGQYFIVGQDPASIKWEQIKTKHVRLIYPTEYAKIAQYYINTLSLSGPYVSDPYQTWDKQKRISIILHNRTTTSNAMVAVAPIRGEFYEMPPQNSYPQIWQDQLVLHEYRHVAQISSMRQGLTKGLYYVFGEQAIAAVMGLWLPFWYIEGDAVYAESLLSNSGRGRTPDFMYTLKAQVLDLKIYKYDKAVYGSFRDFVPDHYTLGYQLVTRGVQDYGFSMWKNTVDRVARRAYYMVPFTTSLKRQTGLFKVQYYNSTLKSLRNEWWLNDKKSIDTSIRILSKDNRFYTNYLFPSELDDGSVIVEVNTINDINRFVLITPGGQEKRLFTPGYDLKEALTSSGNLLCWNERGYDPRWGMRNYSRIKLYDFNNKKLTTLTRRSRYLAPAISNNGKWVVTVHVSEQSLYSLHILDVGTGEVLKEIKTRDNLFFMTPQWSQDDDYIIVAVLGKQGKSIVKISTASWEIEYMLPFTFKEIKRPAMHGDWVVFTGAQEGKDNLYAINAKTKKTYRIFEARFGATNAAFSKDGKKLYFSYYTADGYRLAELDFVPGDFEPVILNDLRFDFLIDKLNVSKPFNLDNTTVPDTKYPVKKYKKGGHLFNIHSWAPLSVDANNYTILPGVTILSQNMLSTSVVSLGYQYDPNERTNKITFGYDYYGWYPIIGLGVDYGGRRVKFTNEDGELEEIKWRETNLSLTLSVPLNLTSSKWVKGMRLSVSLNQRFLRMDPEIKRSFREDRTTIPTYRLYAYNQYKTSPKDLYPHWGQNLDLIFRNTPLSDSISSQLAMIGWVYFPGIIKHQGIRIYGGYQKTLNGNYTFSNILAIPRGYSNVSYPDYFTIRSDYAFPIAYPDWNVPGFFYLKRIYSKLFYDYLQGYNNGKVQELSSTGAELYTDWNFLSVMVNFRLGMRVSHRFWDNTQRYEFLFGIDLNY